VVLWRRSSSGTKKPHLADLILHYCFKQLDPLKSEGLVSGSALHVFLIIRF
jgi:hypothetical protein